MRRAARGLAKWRLSVCRTLVGASARLLLVVRRPESETTVTADDIRNAIRTQVTAGRISQWAVPERVEFVEKLEKTSVGKLDKKALRTRYAGDIKPR